MDNISTDNIRPSSRQRLRRRSIAVALVAALAAVAAACVPAPGPTPPTTTVPGTVRTVSNAQFEWTVSDQANNGSFAPGQVNYWSAGESDSTESTYVATDGDATVLKKNAAGAYVPIGSESSVNWANRTRNGNGTVVTAFNAALLDQKVRLSGGDGTVNTATGQTQISWDGTFSINFYGSFVPFWIIDPVLTVDPGGAGRITATMGGFASDISDPNIRTSLPETPGVVVAEFANAYASGNVATGFTSPTEYVGRSVTTPPGAPQVAQSPANQAFWGAWPQSFVNFQNATGLGSYWYTSGGAADARKPSNPVNLSWTLNP